jgi:hypothetical protein|tara:strand:+ start:1662 stop:2702 length:1041 start_codon:yes stop_codon:yes gene_type:complete
MKKNLLISTLALLIFSAQAQITVVPCDSIDITVDPNSTHYQPSFSSNWIQSSIYNNGTLSPYFATSSLSGILLSEDSAFTHNVFNMSPSGSYYDTIVTCFAVEGLDSLPNTPIGALTWSCGVDMSGNLIYCETFAWDGLVWNLITPPAPTPSWDCDPTIGCFDPGTGNGMYTTYADCDTNCSSNNWSWNNFTVCDSLDIEVVSSTANSVTLGTNLASLPYSGPVSYEWADFNSNSNGIFVVDTTANPTFNLNVLDTTIYFLTVILVDTTGMTWNCMFPVAVFNNGNQWVALRTESPTTNTLNLTPVNDKKLLRIIDALGREVSRIEKNTLLFYIFDDGSIDKRIIR